jgi:hypothetical protein
MATGNRRAAPLVRASFRASKKDLTDNLKGAIRRVLLILQPVVVSTGRHRQNNLIDY